MGPGDDRAGRKVKYAYGGGGGQVASNRWQSLNLGGGETRDAGNSEVGKETTWAGNVDYALGAGKT